MNFKKWVMGKPDREFAKQASLEFDIDPFTALIAGGRGINDLSELEYFLSDELLISDPKLLADIDKAAAVINEAIDSKIKIAVYGDYDCDGVCATAIMYKYLLSRGADTVIYIPDRISEGYGMNISAVDKLKSMGVELIITVDNGIACIKEIEYASSLGIVTVVTDHHIPSDILPDAAAVVDPNRLDCKSDFKQICGAEVAFKVICVTDNKEPEELLPLYSDLLSIAIIGDFMPLIKENRSIVKEGINQIKNNHNLGVSAILSVAGIEKSNVDSGKLSFGIVPRINAAGRMGDAKRAFELLISDNIMNAISLANEIDLDNANRQKTEKEIFADAVDYIEQSGLKYNRVIVVCGDGYHTGIIGIVAAKICEKYGKPAIVFSKDGELCHGSCRSVNGFDIFDALKHCESVLEKFGGHKLAAGVTVKYENLEDFRIKINGYAKTLPNVPPQINIDFKINPSALSVDMVDAINVLEPFGNENPQPVFGIFELKLKKITPLANGKHLKLLFSKDDTTFNALLFGVSPQKFCFNIDDTLDIAVTLDLNTYMNQTNLSVIIKAIRPSGMNDTEVFDDIVAVDDYRFYNTADYNRLVLSREDVGTVYKYILNRPSLADNVIYKHINTLGYAKTVMAIDVLKEIGLVSAENDIISVTNSEKKDLMTSKTYKELSQRGGNV